MHLLYCDESNLQEKSGDFFTYAGVLIDGKAALSLSRAIDTLRANAGLPEGFLLKFNPRPDALTHEQFKNLKQRIIETAIEHGVGLVCSVILHDIATSPDDARRNEINRICYHFDCILNRYKDHGLVLIDRFNDGQIDAHLVEKFSIGLRDMPFSKKYRLHNIVGFHYSAIGQSNFPSVIDIVLGSLRYAINAVARNETGKLEGASTLLKMLAPMFYREPDATKVSELGMFFSPKTIKSKKFFDHYSRLHAFLAANGIDPEQAIVSGG